MNAPLSDLVAVLDDYRPRRDSDLPPGLVEYTAQTAVRDLIALHGPSKARWLLSMYLEDEVCRHGKDA